MRSLDAAVTSTGFAQITFFFFDFSAARTFSPGSTYGTKTVFPSACASPSPPYTSFSIDNSNSSDILIGPILRFFALKEKVVALGKRRSGKVIQAQARQSKFFEQTLLRVLFFDQSDLFRLHFSTVGCKLAVHLSPDLQHSFFACVARQCRVEFVVQDCHPSFQIFEVQCTWRIKDRRRAAQ